MDDTFIDRMGRRFRAVCKTGGMRAGTQKPVFHAVTPDCRIALCGAEPGPRSAWGEPAGAVTCPACLTRLSRLQGAPRQAGQPNRVS
ncbi:MAG TPA: hypothetical protein VFN42_13320 [Acetobacteraceae bacterium]|nr:hypothetical protein [Acetobacteraceae bacterium]